MSYKKEHPYWVAPSDFDISAIEKLGFEDMSWHDDAFPFWGQCAGRETTTAKSVKSARRARGKQMELQLQRQIRRN